jgi:hypothetical protein
MKIHFCDLCNESVPQSDLDIGRAFMRKGRVVCATCDQLMSAREAEALAARGGSAPAGSATLTATAPAQVHVAPVVHPAPSSTGAGIALAAAALGIVLTLVLGYWATDQLNQIRGGFDARASELDASQHRARLDADNATNKLSTEIAALAKTIADGDAEQRTLLENRLRESGEQARNAAAQFAALQTRVDEIKVSLEHLSQRDATVTDLEQRTAALEDQIKQVAAQVELALKAATANAPGAGKPSAPDNKPAWMGLVEQLKSQSQSDRWQAVNALGETRDAAAAPYLIPMLQDKDLFVRMTAARSLGDLGSSVAVGPLIATLGDSASPVREAAYLALRTITKRDLPFDPQTEDTVERGKRIRAWEEWWKKESGA